MLMDIGVGIQRHKAVFWACMFVAAVAMLAFAYKASSFILG